VEPQLVHQAAFWISLVSAAISLALFFRSWRVPSNRRQLDLELRVADLEHLTAELLKRTSRWSKQENVAQARSQVEANRATRGQLLDQAAAIIASKPQAAPPAAKSEAEQLAELRRRAGFNH